MINFTNLKLEIKLVELIDEQTDLNIPIKYDAIYFHPIENEFISKFLFIIILDGEVVEINEKSIKLEFFGCIIGFVDLEPIIGNLNVNLSPTGNSISILSSKDKKNQTIKEGDLLAVKLLKHFVRSNKSPVLACQLDLNNLSIYSK